MVYRDAPENCPKCYEVNQEMEYLKETLECLQNDREKEFKATQIVRIYIAAALLFTIFAASLGTTCDLLVSEISKHVRSPFAAYLCASTIGFTVVGMISGFVYAAVVATRVAKQNHHF